MAIAARVGCKIPKNTNLTHPECEHLIKGPYTTGAANTTLYTSMAVTVDSAGAMTACASKARPAGVIIADPAYPWTTAIPFGLYVVLPSLIDVYICVRGPILVAMTIGDVTEAVLPIGSPVYATGSGRVSVELDLATGTAGEFQIGSSLDENAGFTTLAAGADGDLVEVDLDLTTRVVSTS